VNNKYTLIFSYSLTEFGSQVTPLIHHPLHT